MNEIIQTLSGLSSAWFGPHWGPALFTLGKTLVLIVCIVAPMFLCVAYLTLWERKLIGWIQIRIGPNRVGPFGLLQPIADGVKLLFKEIILPTNASKGLFILAPMVGLMPALAAWAVIPFSPEVVLADVNAGLLYIWRSPPSAFTASSLPVGHPIPNTPSLAPCARPPRWSLTR